MKRPLLRRLFVAALLLPLVGGGATLAIVYSGAYDVAATRQHTAPVYWLFRTAGRQSIKAHASREGPQPPDLRDGELVAAGLALYDRHCVQCHGAPGVAPGPVGLGLNPPPPNLVLPAREFSARELYWTVSNGVKMTGMPAWEFRLSERERWALVAFLKVLPTLSPSEYREHRPRLAPSPVPAEGQP